MKKSSLFSILFALIPLICLPIIFRKPAATITKPEEIALIAAELSNIDTVWVGGTELFNGMLIPVPGTVALGSHEYYPYLLATIRDIVTGDVLVLITSPFEIPSTSSRTTQEDLSVDIVIKGSKAMVLLHGQTEGSWPALLFSVITNG